jgi:hypothetical protein
MGMLCIRLFPSCVLRGVTLCKKNFLSLTIKKGSPVTGLEWPRGFHEVKVPRFQDSRHMKVVRLSALRTGRLYPQESRYRPGVAQRVPRS